MKRRGGSAGAVEVSYATQDGTATAGSDYTPASGRLRFESGETFKFIVVPFLDDTLAECNETFRLRLSNPSGGAVLGSVSETTLVVADNEQTLQGLVEGVSVRPGEPERTGNASSTAPSISADGRFIAFDTYATDLVPGFDVPVQAVALRDRTTASNRLVSVNLAGTGTGNRDSSTPILSADGRYVAFLSRATDLVPQPTFEHLNVFMHQRQLGPGGP